MYKLEHLKEVESALPNIQTGFKTIYYFKMGRNLNKVEKDILEKQNVGVIRPDLPYKFGKVVPIYLNHLVNLVKLNKEKDPYTAIENYITIIKDKALGVINNKIKPKDHENT